MLKGDLFLKSAPGARPFTSPAFHQVVAAVSGANQEINASILAFIVFKLAELLGDPAWNLKAHKIEADVSSKFGFSYIKYLDMAIAHSGTVVVATIPSTDEEEDPRETWIRIAYEYQPQVPVYKRSRSTYRTCYFLALIMAD